MLRFESGRVLLVHLRMTGSFRHVADGKLELDPYRRAVAQLDDGSRARLPRRAALRHLAPARAGRGRAVPRRRGSAPSRSAPTSRRARSRRGSRAGACAVKTAILDQRTVAGVGNIYADEALWRARIHPLREARSLDAAEVRALHRAIRRALELGIARQGSTLSDYRQPNGAAGRDAGRVQGLRPRGRAVRPLRDADRAHRRRRPGHVVLPLVPGSLRGEQLVEPPVAHAGARARCSRRSGGRRSGSAAPSSRRSDPSASRGSPARRPGSPPRRRCPAVEQRLRALAVAAPARRVDADAAHAGPPF